MPLADDLDYSRNAGLVTVVAQDAGTGAVLMVAHADREAIERTEATGEMHYLSRTRGPWHKGATSGNVQRVVSLEADCDADAVLARVVPAGPACHNGTMSCFAGTAQMADVLSAVDVTIRQRASALADGGEHPTYTQRLLADRNLRLKKIGEEAAEFVTACADGNAERATEEAADIFYHTLVALRALGIGLDDVRAALAARR
jgi:phosphoribosyl-AMP cyclohydrolase / phosphoribosyl-ATP pyrophosphohydrolase